MSTDTRHSYTSLRRMSEDEARDTLTVTEYERWERVNNLLDGHEETKDMWDGEAETVAALTVHADKSDLGTEVEVFGNDLLIYTDAEDERIREIGAALRDEFEGVTPSNAEELSTDDIERLASLLTELMGAAVVEFNGTDFAALSDRERRDVLADCREKWGIQGLVFAWLDIVAAIQADRDERLDVVESFRDPKRRGNRPIARNDGVSDIP